MTTKNIFDSGMSIYNICVWYLKSYLSFSSCESLKELKQDNYHLLITCVSFCSNLPFSVFEIPLPDVKDDE